LLIEADRVSRASPAQISRQGSNGVDVHRFSRRSVAMIRDASRNLCRRRRLLRVSRELHLSASIPDQGGSVLETQPGATPQRYAASKRDRRTVP
jgi:hypothetical protein